MHNGRTNQSILPLSIDNLFLSIHTLFYHWRLVHVRWRRWASGQPLWLGPPALTNSTSYNSNMLSIAILKVGTCTLKATSQWPAHLTLPSCSHRPYLPPVSSATVSRSGITWWALPWGRSTSTWMLAANAIWRSLAREFRTWAGISTTGRWLSTMTFRYCHKYWLFLFFHERSKSAFPVAREKKEEKKWIAAWVLAVP